jgi:hypothetical protein
MGRRKIIQQKMKNVPTNATKPQYVSHNMAAREINILQF